MEVQQKVAAPVFEIPDLSLAAADNGTTVEIDAKSPACATQVPMEAKGASPAPPSFLDATSVEDACAHVLRLIHAEDVDAATATQMMKDTLHNWSAHVNPGFLKYRKSVAEEEGYAALEWRDGRPGGSTVIDAAGKEYIDLLGGFGIYSCGHSHPTVVAAVRAQLAKQPLHSQELLDPLRAYAASILCRTMPGPALRDGYVFFTNSGTESVEACIKFALLSTGRRHFIGVLGAFHGKSLGSLSGTSRAAFRRPFAAAGALLPFTHVPVNDVAALRAAFAASRATGNEVAAFLVEPVLGEGGIHVCSDEFLRAGRALCTEYGARLIFDEVQSGMGRTGTWWACEHAGVCPDLMAVAKGFGGGVMGAGCSVGTAEVMRDIFENPFIHTTTFGGNPMSLAAAIAAMQVTVVEGLPANATARGNWLVGQINALVARYPHLLVEVRGRGLMLGLEFRDDAIGFAFSKGVFARGCLLAGTLAAARVLRIEPPLTITAAECETVIARFADTLAAMHAAGLGERGRVPPASLATFGVVVVAEAIACAAAAAAVESKQTGAFPAALPAVAAPAVSACAEAEEETAASPRLSGSECSLDSSSESDVSSVSSTSTESGPGGGLDADSDSEA